MVIKDRCIRLINEYIDITQDKTWNNRMSINDFIAVRNQVIQEIKENIEYIDENIKTSPNIVEKPPDNTVPVEKTINTSYSVNSKETTEIQNFKEVNKEIPEKISSQNLNEIEILAMLKDD